MPLTNNLTLEAAAKLIELEAVHTPLTELSPAGVEEVIYDDFYEVTDTSGHSYFHGAGQECFDWTLAVIKNVFRVIDFVERNPDAALLYGIIDMAFSLTYRGEDVDDDAIRAEVARDVALKAESKRLEESLKKKMKAKT